MTKPIEEMSVDELRDMMDLVSEHLTTKVRGLEEEEKNRLVNIAASVRSLLTKEEIILFVEKGQLKLRSGKDEFESNEIIVPLYLDRESR
jgi:hypothetical protein